MPAICRLDALVEEDPREEAAEHRHQVHEDSGDVDPISCTARFQKT